MLKNSFARKVFGDLGIAAGSEVKVRGAIADGQSVAFAVALKMPTRLEAISNVAGMVLAPAARLAQLITSPGATVAGQIKQVGEKAEAPAA